jgi:hypothetical protein
MQGDLDEAIRQYKAARASTYRDLVDAVERNLPGARKSARNLFGRNAIVRALGVKGRAMVSKSPVWRQIAQELRLEKVKNRPRYSARGVRLTLEMAEERMAKEKTAEEEDQPQEESRHAVREKEATRFVQANMDEAAAAAVLRKLESGEITPDQARQTAALTAEQRNDQRSKHVYPRP